jgi:hypothetical protein
LAVRQLPPTTVVWGIEIGFGALLMAYFLILAASTAAATRST